ncbi:hypothetical protein D3C79_989350 [compost metagenome]
MLPRRREKRLESCSAPTRITTSSPSAIRSGAGIPVTKFTVSPGYSCSISAVIAASTFCAIVDEQPMRRVPMGVLLKA